MTTIDVSSDFIYTKSAVSNFSAIKTGNRIHVTGLITVKMDIGFTPLNDNYMPKIAFSTVTLNYNSWGDKELQCFVPVAVNENGLLVINSSAPFAYTVLDVIYEC